MNAINVVSQMLDKFCATSTPDETIVDFVSSSQKYFGARTRMKLGALGLYILERREM